MTARTIELHPSVVARWERAFPRADLSRFVAQAMLDAVKQAEREQEAMRWRRFGAAGPSGSAS